MKKRVIGWAAGALLVAGTASAQQAVTVESSATASTPAIDPAQRAPAPARAEVATIPDAPPRYDMIRVNAGLRVGYVPSRAFDQFASSDVLTQFSVDGTYPLLTRGRAVLAAGLGWNVGGRTDELRGYASTLTVHRFAVPIEGRYHVAPWIYAFGKVAPGAAVALASVRDGSTSSELSGTGWGFAADASLGASIMVGSRHRPDERRIRFWITPELGYAYTTDVPVVLNASRDERDVLGADQDTTLRSLALSGFFWRASVGATF